ncbi:EamA family transporter [Nocardioides sp. zg-579]|uniref:EamA family transporter n=1 Tax=Nocardioides marmotae TaxID=2663857 RepID=A0A6I3JB27_9ACTN|nr:EamA family transporter [Nocardioides marmotae]MCR6031688.1 EamA family transporter [Gordonia jinghuaiqii]MTB95327.1 EamA family transporter [Nocardioides marmotae]QKE02212.1 EamA family transporter [Nocardioides marmotae]
MSTLTDDSPEVASGPRLAGGLGFALVSALSFGLSGALATGLLAAGWSPGSTVLVRVGLAAVVVLPFGVWALGGRWDVLRRNAGTVVLYGLLAVAGAQFCYFSAVQHMQVGPALLIEYTAPAAVVCWLWLRHGQRPGPVTLLGAGVAALGLVLVLDLVSGADLSPVGVAWALGAMVGVASYFIISADTSSGLPPLALAAGGLVVGALVLGLLGLVGLLPMRATTATVVYADREVAWWVPLLVLGLVTAAVAYCTGIAAGRRLGSRLASFVALLEVVAGVVFAWLLLEQLPRTVQLVGGLLVLVGVVGVKLGERQTAAVPATPAAAPTSVVPTSTP